VTLQLLDAPMCSPQLRSPRERILQTLWFEAIGVVGVTPLYALLFGTGVTSSLKLTVAMALAALLWAPLYNTTFDWMDLRATGRVASDRPRHLRVVHAVLHEAGLMIVTVPLVMWIGMHAVLDAVLIDVGFSLFYAAYAYVFHRVYDHKRPVRANAAASSTR
jgi:uncharacterized membrane protein